jgi:hypothetical protein
MARFADRACAAIARATAAANAAIWTTALVLLLGLVGTSVAIEVRDHRPFVIRYHAFDRGESWSGIEIGLRAWGCVGIAQAEAETDLFRCI